MVFRGEELQGETFREGPGRALVGWDEVGEARMTECCELVAGELDSAGRGGEPAISPGSPVVRVGDSKVMIGS